MTGDPTPLRLATVDDRAGVVATVMAAFESDPAFRWFFPGAESWQRNGPLFIGGLFDSRVGQGATWVTDGLEAVAMWVDPDTATHRPHFTGLDEDARQRLDAYDRATHDSLPDRRHWYLGILATHPDHRGRRLGRAAMEPGLRAAAASGLPAYLETTNDENVSVYERVGWSIAASKQVDTLNIRLMVHDGIS